MLAVSALVVFVLLGGIGFLPLFGGPGYEQSLASGLVVPSVAAISTALALVAAPAAPLAGVRRGVARGAALAGVAFVTALLHGARVGICDFWGGTVFFVLTAGIGAVLGGVWGAVAAPFARARRRPRLWCVILGLAAPLAGIVVSVARFYASPMVFAYDPFFGYFSGTLYDTVVDTRPELWTYRAGSLMTLGGVAIVASALPLPVGRGWRACTRLALGLTALGASLAHCAYGPALGHWQSPGSIARALGGRVSGARCDVVCPDSLAPRQAALLLRDCEEELAAVEGRLGARLDGRVTAFVFADADQKRRLMGAADVSIAKPWRREVYIQMATYPHPVLGHELAHVVAGSFARGPFRVAGRAGGLWPNPGLIEGIAVAASPDDDELTDAQWARAMLDAGILPTPSALFSLGFLGQSAEKGYTVAGAFVGWVLERWGAEVVRAWYGGGELDALTGQGASARDEAFRAWLRSLPMPAEATAYAKAKFERQSIWARTCPHVVDALDRAADQCRDQHRFDRALALYEDALARDPHDWHARLDRDRVRLRSGVGAAGVKGRADLAQIASDDLAPTTWRDRALEALADADVLAGRDAAAIEAYHAVAGRTLDEDVARTLEVKALGLETPAARRAVIDLLIGTSGRTPDPWLGAFSLGQWAGEAPSPLASYLVGRNLGRHDEWARAVPWLDDALAQGLPTARIHRETLRQRTIAACVLGDGDGLRHIARGLDAPDSPFAADPGGRRAWLLRLIARCASR